MKYPDIRSTAISNYIQPAGDLFIKLIKMVVVPIVFTSMVVGIAGVGDGKSLEPTIYFHRTHKHRVSPGVIVVVASELSYQEESEVQVEDETNVFC